MKYIVNKSTDPYFNLAAEEYYLDNMQDDIITLWRNSPSVIIGKNQNAYRELNLEYIRANNIAVVRRLTGGGAVFHDLGNINFTFITAGVGHIDFSRFTAPIILALKGLGIDARLEGRNDIVVGEGFKISGNAQCNHRGRTLHHGTLLFDVNMTNLTGALNADPEKVKSKSIKSIKSRVVNIYSQLKCKMEVEEFLTYLENFLTQENKCGNIELNESQIAEINRLKETKYKNPDYVYGSKISYEFNKTKYLGCGLVEVSFNCIDGIMRELKIYGDFFGVKEIEELENYLCGVKHNADAVAAVLEQININDYINGIKTQELVNLFM